MNKDRDFNEMEHSNKDRLKQRFRLFFRPVCLLVLGVSALSLGLFLETPFVGSIIRVSDPRLLPWEIIFLFPIIAILPLQIWRGFQEWGGYDSTEKRDVIKCLIFWGAFVAALLLFSMFAQIGRLPHFSRSTSALFFPQAYSSVVLWRTSRLMILSEPTVLSSGEVRRDR